MKKKMTLRFILLALGGLALGGAITYLWWLAAYQWKAAPAPFPDVAFFTGFGMILIGILALTSAGNLQAPTAAPGERGGPFQLFRSSKAVAKEAAASSKDSGRLALPGVELDTPALTPGDLENLDRAAEVGTTHILQPFVRENPHIQISISCQSSYETIEALEKGIVDKEQTSVIESEAALVCTLVKHK